MQQHYGGMQGQPQPGAPVPIHPAAAAAASAPATAAAVPEAVPFAQWWGHPDPITAVPSPAFQARHADRPAPVQRTAAAAAAGPPAKAVPPTRGPVPTRCAVCQFETPRGVWCAVASLKTHGTGVHEMRLFWFGTSVSTRANDVVFDTNDLVVAASREMSYMGYGQQGLRPTGATPQGLLAHRGYWPTAHRGYGTQGLRPTGATTLH